MKLNLRMPIFYFIKFCNFNYVNEYSQGYNHNMYVMILAKFKYTTYIHY